MNYQKIKQDRVRLPPDEDWGRQNLFKKIRVYCPHKCIISDSNFLRFLLVICLTLEAILAGCWFGWLA